MKVAKASAVNEQQSNPNIFESKGVTLDKFDPKPNEGTTKKEPKNDEKRKQIDITPKGNKKAKKVAAALFNLAG